MTEEHTPLTRNIHVSDTSDWRTHNTDKKHPRLRYLWLKNTQHWQEASTSQLPLTEEHTILTRDIHVSDSSDWRTHNTDKRHPRLRYLWLKNTQHWQETSTSQIPLTEEHTTLTRDIHVSDISEWRTQTLTRDIHVSDTSEWRTHNTDKKHPRLSYLWLKNTQHWQETSTSQIPLTEEHTTLTRNIHVSVTCDWRTHNTDKRHPRLRYLWM